MVQEPNRYPWGGGYHIRSPFSEARTSRGNTDSGGGPDRHSGIATGWYRVTALLWLLSSSCGRQSGGIGGCRNKKYQIRAPDPPQGNAKADSPKPGLSLTCLGFLFDLHVRLRRSGGARVSQECWSVGRIPGQAVGPSKVISNLSAFPLISVIFKTPTCGSHRGNIPK
jgi:hypothetical protein